MIGDVNYDAERIPTDGIRSFLAPCNGGDFAPLPGAAVETSNLATRWGARRGSLSVLDGSAATELAVSAKMEGKAVVHIATHGFFATGDCRSALDNGVGYDPMLLSGLALAGANHAPEPSSTEDGILTASEVATLDLSSTGLVVLSACDTGLGEIRQGQGVLGLRRAFAIAGARTLVMSLWAVPDDETAHLMDAFYARHLKRRGVPAAVALRDAQLEVLGEQRDSGVESPYAWAAFIMAGDWTI